MMTIKKVLEKAGQMVSQHLSDYSSEIEDAYLRADDKLKVTLGATISPSKKGNAHKLKTEISFTALKIKDGEETTVYDGDGPLFDKSKPKKPVPKKPKHLCGQTEGGRRRMRMYIYH